MSTPPENVSFEELSNTMPESAVLTNSSVKIRLKRDGVDVGYVGISSNSYVTVVPKDDAVEFEQYLNGGKTYYRRKAQNASYLSAETSWDTAGYYFWGGAYDWTLNGTTFICSLNNGPLSQDTSGGYVYASSAYKLFEVYLES